MNQEPSSESAVSPKDCFAEQQLLDYSLGKLDHVISSEIADHLNGCEVCEQTVVGFDREEDTLVGKLVKSSCSEPNANGNPQTNLSLDEDFQIQGLIDKLKHRETGNSVKQYPTALTSENQIGDYRIIRTLGKGGMGTVFQATHRRLEKDVALKVLPERKMQNPESIARFRREMRIIGKLDHPSIVQATDAGEDQGAHYLAMEYVDGFDLSRLTRLVTDIDVASCCEIIRQASLGIEYVHSLGVIHRDIKPSNLMLTSDGAIKILDLGLAMLSGLHGIVDELTTVGQLMGTIDYMAPEQYGDCHLVDARADIYSLGATLYRLLTGEAPYAGQDNESPLKKLQRIAIEPSPSIRSKVPSIDTELAAVIDRCLSRDKEDRYHSAADVANALAPFAGADRLVEIANQAAAIDFTNDEVTPEHQIGTGTGQKNLIDEAFLPERQSGTEHGPDSELSQLASKVAVLETEFGSKNRNRWWAKTLIGLIVLGATICLGIVIQIELDKGNLVIESDVAGIKVSLLKDGKYYDELELEQGSNSTRIRAGKYEVVIDEAAEKMVVENNQFKLTRGETIIAKISRTKEKSSFDLGIANSTFPKNTTDNSTREQSLNGPVYQGLTLERWLAKIKSDVLNPDNANSYVTIDASPVRALISDGKQSTVEEAIQFWISVIDNEKSINQLYVLTKLFDALAFDERSAESVTTAFVNRLMRCSQTQIQETRIRYGVYRSANTGSSYRTTQFAIVFKNWSQPNRDKIELKLFDKRNDGKDSISALRRSFISRINFQSTVDNFDATHQNILSLIRLSETGSKDDAHYANDMMRYLIADPTKLKLTSRNALQSHFELMVKDADFTTKSTGIQLLAKLAPDSRGLEEEITRCMELHPQVVSSLARVADPAKSIEKMRQLLMDENWGWDQKTRNASFSTKTTNSGGLGGATLSGMLGGGSDFSSRMSGGGGGMGMAGGMATGMGGGGSAQDIPQFDHPRFTLVYHLSLIGTKAKSLVPILKKQQEFTDNSAYLDLVWNAVSELDEAPVPPTYKGRELYCWKKKLKSPKSDIEFATAMIACAELIGEIDFESRFYTRRGRSSRSSSLRDQPFNGVFLGIENPLKKHNPEYIQYLRDLLPHLQKLDFSDFDLKEKTTKEGIYSDPRKVAFLLCQNFVLPLFATSSLADFPFLATLEPATDVSSYQSFQEAAFKASAPGSLLEARLVWDMHDRKFEEVLLKRFNHPDSHLITRLKTLYLLTFWETERSKYQVSFDRLVAQNPVETLGLLQTTRKGAGRFHRFVASAAIDCLLKIDELNKVAKPTTFPKSNSVIRQENWLFARVSFDEMSNISRILDCLEINSNQNSGSKLRGTIKELATCFAPETGITTKQVRVKLRSVLSSSDRVTAARVESMLKTLDQVDEILEPRPKKTPERKKIPETKQNPEKKDPEREASPSVQKKV